VREVPVVLAAPGAYRDRAETAEVMDVHTRDMLLAALIIFAAWWVPRLLGGLHVWRRCACGALYCRTCNRKGN
jgi:hypothetical protein